MIGSISNAGGNLDWQILARNAKLSKFEAISLFTKYFWVPEIVSRYFGYKNVHSKTFKTWKLDKPTSLLCRENLHTNAYCSKTCLRHFWCRGSTWWFRVSHRARSPRPTFPNAQSSDLLKTLVHWLTVPLAREHIRFVPQKTLSA